MRTNFQMRMLGGVALIAFVATGVVGESLAADQPSAAQAADMGEIVVTATRQNELLSRVPISVAAFTQATMDQIGAHDMSDLVGQTPAVRITPSSNNISIRGISSNAGAATAGIYIDDIPLQIINFGTAASGSLPSVFDIERVEVLRGPQGTLFGAGAQGGAIRFITPAPNLQNYTVYARSEIATTEGGEPSFEAGAAVGGPIIQDKLGFRASFLERRRGGWIDNVDYHQQVAQPVIDKNSNWQSTYVARIALGYQPIDDLMITPSILYQDRYSNNRDTFWEYYSDPAHGKFQSAMIPTQDGDRYGLPSLKVDYSLGDFSLISNTSYFYRDQGSSSDYVVYELGQTEQAETATSPYKGRLLLPSGPNYTAYGITNYQADGGGHTKQRNWTQEVRLQTNDPSSPITGVVGFYYSHANQYNVGTIRTFDYLALRQFALGQTPLTVFGYGPNFVAHGYVDGVYGLRLKNTTNVFTTQVAGFADATWAVTDELKVSGGVRVAQSNYSFFNNTTNPAGSTLASGTTKETPITPKGTISYQITPEDMVYATVSKGYRIGGANRQLPDLCTASLAALGITQNPTTYASDTVWNYEIGAKGRFPTLAGLRYNASAFRINWDGIQTNTTLPCGTGYVTNLGQARSQGFDLETSAKVTDFLSLQAAVGYTHTEYLSTSHATPAANAPILVSQGDAINGVVPWTGTVAAIFDFDVANHPSYARLTYEFATKQDMTATQDPTTNQYDAGLPLQPATNLFKLRAGMNFDAIDVSLFVDNLFNSAPMLDRDHTTRTALLYTDRSFRPRTVGLTVTYSR